MRELKRLVKPLDVARCREKPAELSCPFTAQMLSEISGGVPIRSEELNAPLAP